MAVEVGLCGGGTAQEEGLVEELRVALLAFDGDEEREVGAEGCCASGGAITEAAFAEDDREAHC